ncbi:MAG: DUF934 domain-containing protein [Magnetospirillum sp.]|nr:DUF934 domain-containing protein [Magnetospirillum sp.]
MARGRRRCWRGDLHWLDLVVIDFPRFRDGRGFTLARTLRERYGFTGEIRAQGNLLPDQLSLLQRCGFSSIAVPPSGGHTGRTPNRRWPSRRDRRPFPCSGVCGRASAEPGLRQGQLCCHT